MSEAQRLLENLGRLREHVEAVRGGSPTARDDLATVLHVLVGGDGHSDGYGVIQRAFDEVGLDVPAMSAWGHDLPEAVDGEPVVLALRGSPVHGANVPLQDRLGETCLRLAVPGIEPEANWSTLDLIKKVRNKFGSHADRKPPRWLEELRFYPAGDADAVTYLLWRAAEEVLSATTSALIARGWDVEPFEPTDRYLNGIDLTEAQVLGLPGTRLDVRAHLACANWACGARRAIVGARFGEVPFVFGLEADGRLACQRVRQARRWANSQGGISKAASPRSGATTTVPAVPDASTSTAMAGRHSALRTRNTQADARIDSTHT